MLWEDIKDLCYDRPIRQAKDVKFKVMLPWETSEIILQGDSDLHDAFKKLKEKSYRWAFFIVTTELNTTTKHNTQSNDAGIIKINEQTISLQEQFTVHLDDQIEWLDFGEANETMMPNIYVNVPDARQYEYEADIGSHESDFDPENDVDNLWDAGLDDYESTNDSKVESDGEAGDAVMVNYNIYEHKSGDFVFNEDEKKIILKPSYFYKNIDEFMIFMKAYATQNRFRLQRMKNEKSRITFECAALGSS